MPALSRPFSRALILGLVALATMAGAVLSASPVEAQTVPFLAYGSGRVSGEVVRAFKSGTPVGQTTVDAGGNWDINILPGGIANMVDGDRITFTVDDRPAAEFETFYGAHYSFAPGLTLTTSGATAAGGAGALAGTPVFDATGKALAVFNTGTVEQLASEGVKAGATGIWVQDPSGELQVFVIGGPAFINDQFRAKFPTGLDVTSVLLVR